MKALLNNLPKQAPSIKFIFLAFFMKFFFLAFKKEKKDTKIQITAIFFYKFVLNITDYMIYGHESAFICLRYAGI